MAYSPIENLTLGKFLQIAFTEGVRGQISEDYRDWEMIQRHRVDNPNGRELRFLFETSLGVAAVQYRNPNFTTAFPDSQQVGISENTARYKEIDATIELEYNLWKLAQMSPAKYAEPLAREIAAKAIASKRRMAADLYADGTGVIGQLPAASAAVTSPASDQLEFTLESTSTARGFIGFFEFGDILILRTSAGAASALDTSLATEPIYWKVVRKDRKNNKVRLQGLTAAFASAGTITSITTQPAAADVFYRYGQPTIPDLTASISDYGTVTEVMAGLESLIADDGRVIHGITMSGSTAGGVLDAAGAPLDVSLIQEMMDKVKVDVGQGRYSWKMIAGAPEAHAALIESRETDRRFQSIEDNKRGVKVFAYVHGNDVLEMYTSEYCPFKRLYALPEAKSGAKVLEYHGTDFEPVRAKGGDEFMLKPASTGGHQRKVVSYLEAMGVLISQHSAAVGRLQNFTV